MGEVWIARHSMLGRAAAIKIIRNASANDPSRAAELARRFEREARVTAELTCPHTVEVYDFGVLEDGSFYYAMELLDGLDLQEVVAKHGPVPPERAVHFLCQLCESLEEAHGKGLVHRDIKPANVFVTRRGVREDFVKVLDFGLVRSIAQDDEGLALTETGAVIGTPAYLAPEMLFLERPIDHRADIYAVGCVAYWLVTGELVFNAPERFALAHAHIYERPSPPSERAPGSVPSEFDRLVLACLEKDPADRPASAAELGAAFARCSSGRTWSSERAAAWWKARSDAGRKELVGAATIQAAEATPRVEGRRVSGATRWGLLGLALFVIALMLAGVLDRPAAATRNIGFRPLAPSQVDPAVTVVELRCEREPVPSAGAPGIPAPPRLIPRDYRPMHGELIDRLSAAGVRVVVFTLYFGEDDEDIDALAAATARARADGTEVLLPALRRGSGWLWPAPALRDVATAVGSATFVREGSEARLRSARLGDCPRSSDGPAWSLPVLALAAAGESGPPECGDDGRVRVAGRSLPAASYRVPFVADPFAWSTVVAYTEVLAGSFDPADFDGKFVVVGSACDRPHRTPVGDLSSSAVHAALLNGVLGGHELRVASPGQRLLGLLLVAAVLQLLAGPAGGAPLRWAVVAVAVTGVSVVASWMLGGVDLLVPWSDQALLGGCAALWGWYSTARREGP